MNYLRYVVCLFALILSTSFTFGQAGLIDVAPRMCGDKWSINITSLPECEVDIEVISSSRFFAPIQTDERNILLENVPRGEYHIKATDKCTGRTQTETVTIPN